MKKSTISILRWLIIVAIIAFIIDAILQYISLKRLKLADTWKDYWGNYDQNRALKSVAIGAGIGLGVGLTKQLVFDSLEKEETQLQEFENFNANKYLSGVLEEKKIDRNSLTFKEDQKWIQEVKDICNHNFGNILADVPQDAGSVRKRTSTGGSDYDLVLPFKSNAGSLINLHDEVLGKLRLFTNKGFIVRQQNRSIGLIGQRADGSMLKIDILPAKVRGNYVESKYLTIWDHAKDSHLKTNIDIQNSEFRNKPKNREVVKLLKHYRDTTGLKISSYLLGAIVAKRNYTSSMYGNFRLALEDVRNTMDKPFLKDVVNGNNNLLGNKTSKEKLYIKEKISTDLVGIGENSRVLKQILN